MAAWKQNLVTLSSTLGPEMMSVIESWGPEYNSLLEEYLADPNGEMGQKFYTEMLEATGQGAAGAQSTASQYQAAGSDNIQAYSDALQSNTAPNEAAQIIADGVAGELSRADYSAITTELARAMRALSGDLVEGWNVSALPPHLRMGFQVGQGAKAKFGRELESLQAGLERQVQQQLTVVSSRKQLAGTAWVFGDIPESIQIPTNGIVATGFPALRDETAQVAETLCTNLAEAKASHAQGLARLACLALPAPYKWIVGQLSYQDKIILAASPYPSVPELLADARFAVVVELVHRHNPWAIREQSQFNKLVTAIRPDQVEASLRVVKIAVDALRVLATVQERLEQLEPASQTAQDVSVQVADLIFPGFLHVISPQWLPRLPTWLNGVALRLQNARTDSYRDEARMEQLAPVLDAYAQLLDAHPASTPEIDHIGYLIEEFRIQLFAQSLRTAETVSAKRILKAIAEVTTALA